MLYTHKNPFVWAIRYQRGLGIEDGYECASRNEAQCEMFKLSCEGCVNNRPYVTMESGNELRLRTGDYILYRHNGRNIRSKRPFAIMTEAQFLREYKECIEYGN